MVTQLFFCFKSFKLSLTAPYDSYRPTKESTVRAFWVQASPDSQAHKLGIPMLMNTTAHQDQFLTQDLLNELVSPGLNNYHPTGQFAEVKMCSSRNYHTTLPSLAEGIGNSGEVRRGCKKIQRYVCSLINWNFQRGRGWGRGCLWEYLLHGKIIVCTCIQCNLQDRQSKVQ